MYSVKCPYIFIFIEWHSRPLLGATIALNLVSWVLKKIFSSEMDKKDICLGSASKQNAPFSFMPPMSE